MKKAVFWVMALGILVMGLSTGRDLWAAPGQHPARQTVPTRTPVTPPTQPPPSPTKPPSPEKKPTTVPTATVAPTPAAEVIPAEESSQPLLPDAGSPSIRFQLGLAMVVAGLLALAVVRQKGITTG